MDFQYQISSISTEQFLTLNMQFIVTIFQLCSFHAHCAYTFPSVITLQMCFLLFTGGWQHWSTPLTDGSRWADASASDVGLTRNPVIATQPSWAMP